MHNFKRLTVWKRSIDLAIRCYRQTETFPRTERYGLSSQIQRAAVSIASNIAEGSSRPSPREFARYLQIAYGSGCELETQLLVARSLVIGKPDELQSIMAEVEEIRRMLYGLMARTAATTPSRG
ncbi:MAG: four helix bundle protein [Proteobacteria bacterium]|nr:four helix bundle protein [Pseudomonadota bacterium]